MAMVKIDIDWRSFYVRFFDPSIPSAYAKMYRFSTAAMAWVTGSSPHGRTMAQVIATQKNFEELGLLKKSVVDIYHGTNILEKPWN